MNIFKKINIKALIIAVAIPLVVGVIGTLLGGSTDVYDKIITPAFAPPGILFPIVWTILYILMGISSYLVYMTPNVKKGDAFSVYALSLVLNCLWSFIFFRLNLYLLAFIWIIALLVSVIIYTVMFYRINKIAGYLQIPYIVWTSFASVLAWFIYTLN